MELNINSYSINFCRKLKASEEQEYADVLKRGRNIVAGENTNNTLIIPSVALPQASANNTGVGSITSEDGLKFVDFAKKYWGINEIQLLPVGQYHSSLGEYPCYSGTSMDFGNHLIDVKSILSKEKFNRIVQNNNVSDKVNYSNVVEFNSAQEKVIKELYNSMNDEMKREFEAYKVENAERIQPKGVFRALTDKYGTVEFSK